MAAKVDMGKAEQKMAHMHLINLWKFPLEQLCEKMVNKLSILKLTAWNISLPEAVLEDWETGMNLAFRLK